MLDYIKLKRDRRKFLALTGLTLKEFKALLPAFAEAYRRRYRRGKTLVGRKRKRQLGGGRRGLLRTGEQKLLFILVYQKTYPLQVGLGELFSRGQSGAHQWRHCLVPVLLAARTALGVRPQREGRQFALSERRTDEPREYSIDGPERRRQRPTNPENQALHSRGKNKTHSDKKVVIVQTHAKRVAYLRPTYTGKTPDKQVADREQST